MSTATSTLTTPVPFGTAQYAEVIEWLYREARLLDRGDFNAWLALLAEDISYEMPTRTAVLSKDGPGFDPDMGLFADNHASLKTRVARLNTEQAWAEQPRSRTRHYVSNVLVERAHDGLLHVSCALLLIRSRDNRPLDVLAGERQDTLRRTASGLQLARRVVLLDETVISTHNLSMFF